MTEPPPITVHSNINNSSSSLQINSTITSAATEDLQITSALNDLQTDGPLPEDLVVNDMLPVATTMNVTVDYAFDGRQDDYGISMSYILRSLLPQVAVAVVLISLLLGSFVSFRLRNRQRYKDRSTNVRVISRVSRI